MHLEATHRARRLRGRKFAIKIDGLGTFMLQRLRSLFGTILDRLRLIHIDSTVCSALFIRVDIHIGTSLRFGIHHSPLVLIVPGIDVLLIFNIERLILC